MFEKVLVPLDGSPLAEAVIPYVQELARKFDSEVVLLQVVSASPALWAVEGTAGVLPDPATVAQQIDEESQEAENYLQRLSSTWGVAGPPVRWHVEQGVPAERIVQYAREQGVSLIAMSTHGRTGLERLVFGSVADHVLRVAGVPILLIRPTR